ncbi:unnamed protein product, partial [Ectocarpus sp. 12 AP-2014]
RRLGEDHRRRGHAGRAWVRVRQHPMTYPGHEEACRDVYPYGYGGQENRQRE